MAGPHLFGGENAEPGREKMKLDQVKLREPVVDQVRLVGVKIGVGSECEAAGQVWTTGYPGNTTTLHPRASRCCVHHCVVIVLCSFSQDCS